MAANAAALPKNQVYYQHPVIKGGFADPKIHDLPKDLRRGGLKPKWDIRKK